MWRFNSVKRPKKLPLWPGGRTQAVRVFLLLGIYCFVVFGKRWDTMSEAIRLEIWASSQIPTALDPLEPNSYLEAPVCCRDMLNHLPVLSAPPPFSSEHSYVAEGGKDISRRSIAWQRRVWEWQCCTLVTVFLEERHRPGYGSWHPCCWTSLHSSGPQSLHL